MGALHRLLEELMDVLARLSEEAARGVPVLVEGRSDVKALRELGINGFLVAVRTSRKPMADLALEFAEMTDEVIVLTDFDPAGREQAKAWAHELERIGLKANLTFWRYLMGLVGSFVKDIEGLPSLVETLMRKAGHKARVRVGDHIDTCSIACKIQGKVEL